MDSSPFNFYRLVDADRYYFNLRELMNCYFVVFKKRAKSMRLANYRHMMGGKGGERK